MTTITKRRPRRIASDEAHAWARNLRLGNPTAKAVLCILALYVNGETASSFVGIPTLADDCELSPDTVRRRLAWLEEIGAIIRRPQWVDDRGIRNSDNRGKRTSDEIFLMIEADADEIEARARGETIEDDGEISPRNLQGLESVSPAPALGQPSQSCEGLTSEPEPESSIPKSLPSQAEPIAEPEHFAGFFDNCQGHTTMNREKALQDFAQLTADEQVRARAASPLHANACIAFKRRSLDAHKLLRTRFWEQYPHAKMSLPPVPPVWIDDPIELAALRVMRVIADIAPAREIERDGRLGVQRALPVPADLRGLAPFDGDDVRDWLIVAEGTHEFAAWRQRLHDWTGQWVEPRTVRRHGNVTLQIPGLPDRVVDKRERGLPVPSRWPPRKDGSVGERDGPQVPPLTDDDRDALAQEGRRR